MCLYSGYLDEHGEAFGMGEVYGHDWMLTGTFKDGKPHGISK